MKTANISVDYLGGFGSDATVVNAARVSFAKECLSFEEKDSKLIKYLADHKHFSPFNHAFLSFRVKAPIFVARQLQKHRFMPWNEVSRRYVDEEPEFYITELRLKADNVKQGSSSSVYEEGEGYNLCMHSEEVMYSCINLYKSMLENKVAPEVARAYLPQNMMTEWIWSGTLGAFLDMLVLRLDPHTQKESRDVAELIAAHVEERFPISFNARITKDAN